MRRFLQLFVWSMMASLFLLTSIPAAPAAQIITRDSVTLTRPVTDDLYVFGGDVLVEADVVGDLIVFGGQVRTTGDIDGDLMVAGGNVTVNGKVNDSARIAGGSVIITNRIAKDLMVAGGDVLLGRGSVVGRDLTLAAGNLRMLGKIRDDLKGATGNTLIAGPINGDVVLTVEQLNLSGAAKINGNLVYTSRTKAKIAKGAKVFGEIERREPRVAKSPPGLTFFSWLIKLLGTLIVGMLIAWLFPQSLRLARKKIESNTLGSLGMGFAILFLAPIFVLMTMITIIGMPIALITLTIYALSIYIAQIYAAGAIGGIALNRLTQEERWIGADVAVGITAFATIRLIPVIAPLVTFFLILLGLGAMSLACWKSWHPPEQPPN